MSVDYRDLRNELLRYAPEAPLALIVDLLRESAREFFTRSCAWRQVIKFPLVADQSDYDVLDIATFAGVSDEFIPPYATTGAPAVFDAFEVDIVAWHDVVAKESPIEKLTTQRLMRYGRMPSGQLIGFTTPQKHVIRIYGTPNAALDGELVSAFVSLQPSRTRRFIANDDMVDLYKKGIVAGAVKRLLSMPRQPWTNINLSLVHEGDYERAILDADDRAQKEYSRNVTRTTSYGGL